MKYTIQGNANRLIINENGELVATYRQFPKGITSEIMLKSTSIKKENREEFLNHLHSLVDNKLMEHCSNTFLVSPEISGGGTSLARNKYPSKLVEFLNSK
jgi:hypothetical protein